MKKRRRTLLVQLLVCLIGTNCLRAEIPRNDAVSAGALQSMLERIHTHATADAWKQPGFKDDVLEAWLDKLVGKIAKAADFSDLTLPVHFKDVQPGNIPAAAAPQAAGGGFVPPPQLQSALVIGNDVNLSNTSVRNSIILATGNVDASQLDNCVVVAAGAIRVQMMSATSVLIAGVYVKSGQFDGKPGNNSNGSLIITRGWADIGSGYGTMVYAPEGITFERSTGAIFINIPVPQPPPGRIPIPRPADNSAKSITVTDLGIEPLPVHPLASRIAVLGVLHGEVAEGSRFGRVERSFGPKGLLFRFEDRKHVAETGQPIVDEEGQAVDHLRNWKLASLNSRFALFTGTDGTAAVLRVEKKPAAQAGQP